MFEVTPAGTPCAGGAEPSSDSLDLFSAGQYSDDFSEEEEEEVSEARYRQSHRSRQSAEQTSGESDTACLSSKIALDRREKISNKEKKAAEVDAQKSTLLTHNIATINTCLADRIGPPAKPR